MSGDTMLFRVGERRSVSVSCTASLFCHLGAECDGFLLGILAYDELDFSWLVHDNFSFPFVHGDLAQWP